MPRADQANIRNARGPWYVDTRCVGCDAARHWAPGLIEMDDSGRSFVARQPEGDEQEAALWRAAGACPTKSIGNREQPREPEGVFPHRMTDGVLALGNNALSSFGCHSYLVLRPEGNLMIDSPRFSRALAASISRLGGIAHVLLSHRDDVADADRWAEWYGARVWIGEADADAAPYATDLLDGSTTVLISPGVSSIPAPGHTRGHVLYHVDERCLFTGDTLLWNQRRGEFDVTPNQTFHSWTELAATMDTIAALQVEWVFPGHGMWRNTNAEEWTRLMSALGPAMLDLGRTAWAQRPGTPYDWY